jgi:hypothetical protein
VTKDVRIRSGIGGKAICRISSQQPTQLEKKEKQGGRKGTDRTRRGWEGSQKVATGVAFLFEPLLLYYLNTGIGQCQKNGD